MFLHRKNGLQKGRERNCNRPNKNRKRSSGNFRLGTRSDYNRKKAGVTPSSAMGANSKKPREHSNMRKTHFLFVGGGLVMIAVSLYLWIEAYHEIFHPPLIEKRPRGDATDTEPVLSRWIFGSVINVIGNIVSLAALMFRRGSSSPDVHVDDSAAPTLITVPIQHFAPLVSPLLILIAFYQFLFSLLFAFGWNQPSRSTIAIFGAASTLVIALGLLARRWAYQRAVGEMRLELDNSVNSQRNLLTGKLLFSRQSNEAASPLWVSLSIYEKCDWQLKDGGDAIVNLRELYWSIGCATEPGVDNPFQPETEFAFALSIPAWLPMPWSQPTEKESIGIDWELQVRGTFAGKKIALTLPIDSIPATLNQPSVKRIKISKLELEKLLDTQSICWQHSSEYGSSSIARKLRPNPQFLVLFLVASLFSVGSAVLVFLKFQEFFLWSMLTSAVMSIAILGERFIHRSIYIQDGNVIRVWCVFGVLFQSMFRKDQLLQVCIEAKGTRVENCDLHHVEYDIRVRHRRSPEHGLRIARIRYRLTAKAFAKSIASDLDIPFAYLEIGLKSRVSTNRNQLPPLPPSPSSSEVRDLSRDKNVN